MPFLSVPLLYLFFLLKRRGKKYEISYLYECSCAHFCANVTETTIELRTFSIFVTHKTYKTNRLHLCLASNMYDLFWTQHSIQNSFYSFEQVIYSYNLALFLDIYLISFSVTHSQFKSNEIKSTRIRKNIDNYGTFCTDSFGISQIRCTTISVVHKIFLWF